MTTNETLRKAAIVIASLDEHAADQLLESMPEEIASKIRWMSIELTDVSDEERKTVLDEFLQNSGRGPAIPSDDVEVEFTYEQHTTNTLPVEKETPASPTPPPFAFLADAEPEMLAPFFEQEHPQVTAIVLSYLTPERASEILRQLPATLQAEIVHRITQLEEPSAGILTDVEQRIKQIVSKQALAHERRKMGIAAAQAILNVSTTEQAQKLLDELDQQGSRLPLKLRTPSNQVSATKVSQANTYQQEPQVLRSPAPELAKIPSSNIPSPQMDSALKPALVETPRSDTEPATFRFQQLAELDDKTLAQVLQAAGPRVVLLAMCGASPDVMRRLTRGLGPKEVKQFQQRIRDLQPVRLSDIERAQQTLCKAVDSGLASQAHAATYGPQFAVAGGA